MKLLDLCCKAGGCSRGYADAGFDVTGVDMEAQPHYPYRFIQANAFDVDLSEYDVIHVSPHCQGYSTIAYAAKVTDQYSRDIERFRSLLQASGKPYIIENVAGAKKYLIDPIMLCGSFFGLQTYRHRFFESNMPLVAPVHVKHTIRAAQPGYIPKNGEYWCIVGKYGNFEGAKAAMGVDWDVTMSELSNMVPPSYTEYLGRQVMSLLGAGYA